MTRQEPGGKPDEEDAKRPSRPGRPVDLHRVLRAVRWGKWWIAAAALAGSALGLLVGKFVVKHSYEAGAAIRYEGLPGQQVQETQSDLPSLVSVSHSEPMMVSLRTRMGPEGASLDLMRRFVQVEADAGSGLVSFRATAETPARAARMANTLVDIFLAHHEGRRRTELETELGSLDGRIHAAQAELLQARRRYDGFREANQITDLSAEQESAITQAAELRSQADLAQAEIDSLTARVSQLQGAIQSTPRMTAEVSTGSSASSRRLRELRARLSETRSSLSDEHPQVQALRRQVQALERQVGSGEGTSTRMSVNSLHDQLRTNFATAETELEAARHRHGTLEQLAVQAQARTNRFSTIEGQAATLLAHVNVKDALLTELNQQKARVEDQLRDIQTGFRIVNEARPPEDAIPSKRKQLVAASFPVLFLTVVIGGLLFRELRGLRVQTPAEVAFWGNGPVIGATTWPRDARALIDLIADMDDFAPEAKGTMLVVGSSERERMLATEIAGQLNYDWSASTLINVPVLGTYSPRPGRDAVSDDEILDDDGSISGDVEEAHTQLMLAPADLHAIQLLGPSEDDYAEDPDDPADRLICTAWSGPSHGQALRRAARLADRVLVVVTSDGLRVTELSQMKTRLGRPNAVGFVLVGVSDDVARLPDRAGSVEEFWEGGSAK